MDRGTMAVSVGTGREEGRLVRFFVEIQADPNILHSQVEPKSLHASMASLAQSHHQHHGPPMPHHHRMVLGENG